MDRQRPECRLVSGKRQRKTIVARLDVPERQLGVRVHTGKAGDGALVDELLPALEDVRRIAKQAGDRFTGPERIRAKRAEQMQLRSDAGLARTLAPTGVEVDDFQGVDRRAPVAPPQLRLRRVGVRGDAESA